jgi:hypothetical protein
VINSSCQDLLITSEIAGIIIVFTSIITNRGELTMIIVIHDGLESSLAVFVLQRLHFNLINHFFNFVIVLQYKTREVTEFMGVETEVESAV